MSYFMTATAELLLSRFGMMSMWATMEIVVVCGRVFHELTRGICVAFGSRCRELGVRPSMGTASDAYDNAMAESSSLRPAAS